MRYQYSEHGAAEANATPGPANLNFELSSLAERMQHVAAITAKLAPSRIICVCDCHTIRARTRTLALNSLCKCQTRIAALLVAHPSEIIMIAIACPASDHVSIYTCNIDLKHAHAITFNLMHAARFSCKQFASAGVTARRACREVRTRHVAVACA